MKRLTSKKLEVISGGSCLGMISGFSGAVIASMAGPIGILAGAASFAYMIRQSRTCLL